MACPIQRKIVIPRNVVDPVTFAVTLVGYTTIVAPCTRRSKGNTPCKSCLAGRWGHHDKLTKHGRKQLAKARAALKVSTKCAA